MEKKSNFKALKNEEVNDVKIKQKFTHTFRIVFSAGMLGLAIMFSYLANWIKIPFFSQLSLTIDLSIIFIIPVIYLCSLRWAISSAIILSLFNFIWDGANWIGIILLLIVNIVTLIIFYFFHLIINKTKLKSKKIKWLVIWIFIIIANTIVFTTLNGILFTPLYWWWFFRQLPINFIEVAKLYNSDSNLQIFLLGITDYWSGIWSLYTIFNLIKFTLVAFFAIPVLIFFQNSPITKSFFN